MRETVVAGRSIVTIVSVSVGAFLAVAACGFLFGRLVSSTPNLTPERSTSEGAAPSSASSDAIGTLAAAPAVNETTGTIRPAATVGSTIASVPEPDRAPKTAAPVCLNPNGMGVARVVEIDTTGGPGFGFQHFKAYDFLNDHEVVLTFDDGPWLGHTPAVLKALADQCVRATFFSIGKHATYYPEILKRVAVAGHTVGTHTWSHADLQATVKNEGLEAAKEQFEKGASAVRMMAGVPIAPFFRFPDLRHPPEMLTYLGERDVASFSTDIDSWDFKIKKPEELTKSLMGKVRKAGKGIILMHDFQKVTSIALPQILDQLQRDGFKVVHMVPRGTLNTLPQYDEAVLKENKLPTLVSRPADSVVRTINQ